jgi:phage gp37-like protein
MVRNLRAASYAPTEDNRGVYTLNEEKGRLMRKCWTGDDHLEWDDLVVENVKKGTPAVYLVWDGDQGNDARRQVRPPSSPYTSLLSFHAIISNIRPRS